MDETIRIGPPLRKCRDCGFFSITGWRNQRIRDLSDAPAPQPPVYNEATREARENLHTGLGFTGKFICFAGERQWEDDTKDITEPDGYREVLDKERYCDSFYPYVLGHSPKEHAMLKLQERLEAREDRRDQTQRDWQERQEQNAADRHTELLKVAKSGLFWEVAVVGLIATLIIAAVTFGAALIESGQWTLRGD